MEDTRSILPDGTEARKEKTSYLVVETRGELYAVRWELVKEAGILLQTEIDSSVVPPQVERDGLEFPVVYLWDIVGSKPPAEKPIEIPAVFLKEEDRRMVLIPERILWKQEAVLQALPDWVKKDPAVRGAIVLSSGVPVIVLEPFLRSHPLEEVKCGAGAYSL